MTQWAWVGCGMMARTPDFMNVSIAGWAGAAEYFGQNRPEFADNVRRYFEHIRENDVTLTHTLVNLQPRRTSPASWTRLDEQVALTVVKETDAGIVVRGSRVAGDAGAAVRRDCGLPDADAHDWPGVVAAGVLLRHPPTTRRGLKVHLPRELRLRTLRLRTTPSARGSRRWTASCSSTTCWCRGSGCSCWATWICATTTASPRSQRRIPATKWSTAAWSRPSSSWGWRN